MRESARSSSGISPDHRGSAQYSVERPRYDAGTGARAASGATDTTAATGERLTWCRPVGWARPAEPFGEREAPP
jgi:hypothetical protein